MKTNTYQLKIIHVLIFSMITVALLSGFTASGLKSQTVAAKGAVLDEKTKSMVIDSISAALNEVYVFPEVAKKMEQLMRKNNKEGNYRNISDVSEFTNVLTQDLQSVSKDKHLRIRPIPVLDPNASAKLSPEEEAKIMLEQMKRDNFGFKKIEILPGNIGYLDFRYFADAGFGQAGATAIAAMNFLAYTDAIIFDMRQNGGGTPSMIQLITSYLFEEPVHLNSFYVRATGETEQFWTQGYVLGPKLVSTPVYVLTSSYTFSGAEEFTYNLKNLKRGTIIGETTGGGAHPVNSRSFENLGVAMSLPYGRAINPITKTNWEGVGVEPDIKVPADQAMAVAHITAIKNLLDKEKDDAKKSRLGWILKRLEVVNNPVSLNENAMKAYAGSYGPRHIVLEEGHLYYQREGRPKYRMIPAGDDLFMLEGLDNFSIKFMKNDSGVFEELVGMYDNGMKDSNKRTAK